MALDNVQGSCPGLVRCVGRWDVVALMINCIIGAAIFGLPSQIYALSGNYSLFAFGTCGLVVILVALCHAEVSSRFTETGGPYLYARKAFGSLIGFQIGWVAWLARLSSLAFVCNVLVSYLSFFWTPVGSGLWRVVLMVGVVVVLAAINIIGVSTAAIASDILSVAKLVPLLLFVSAGLVFIHSQNYYLTMPPALGSFSLAVSQLFVSFTGFELGLIAAGEVRDPQRNMPFGMLTALGLVVLVYILIQVVCIGTLPDLAASEKPLADASSLFLGTGGASIITLGALISCTGTLNAILLAGSRLPFAMAEQNQLPRVLLSTHRRFHTPHASILLTALIGLVLAVSGTFVYALTLAAISKLLTSVATCAALPVLRRQTGNLPAVFQVPAGKALSAAALGICVWLLANSGWRELRDVGIAVGIGSVLYFVYALKWRKLQPHGKGIR